MKPRAGRARTAAWAHVLAALLVFPMPVAYAQSPAPANANAAAPADSGAVATPDSATTAAPATPGAGLAEARELIRNGDYDRAVELLRGEVTRSAGRPNEQAEAYLLLIKTYVFLGNDYKFRPQGREASNLNYRAAKEQIAECLAIPALRDTRPVPATDYPPEMIAFFAEVRSRMFGSFHVVGLDPPDAVVVLGADTLSAGPDGAGPGANDVPVGSYPVTVRAHGYQDLSETVTISPSATQERSYRLERRRSAWWYVTRGALAVGAVVGIGALVAGSSDSGGSSGPQPLPGAPPPPASAR